MGGRVLRLAAARFLVFESPYVSLQVLGQLFSESDCSHAPTIQHGFHAGSRGERLTPGRLVFLCVEGDGDGANRRMQTMSQQHIPIEIVTATGDDERPRVDDDTRIDVSVDGEMYPTARLEDGRYVAWWFETDAPAPDDPAATEWVAAPTRFLAAATLRELWEDPAAFDSLVDGGV